VGEPFIVVGLGNPGAEYERTRHNTGFLVVDALARRFGGRFRSGGGLYVSCRFEKENTGSVVLLKPLTYMNNSGVAVSEAIDDFGSSVGQILIVVDDIAIPLGRLRARASGSDGGHNGLGSIIHSLETESFARLRCGIGLTELPEPGTMAEFVLSPFGPDEESTVRSMINRAAEAALGFVTEGIDRTMSRYNE